MNFNYFTKPGEILKEYIEERGLTQKEFAEKTESSERHVSAIINGKSKITEEFALKIEKVFPDTTAEKWMELENKYRLHLLRAQSEDSISDKYIVEEFKLKSVFEGTKIRDMVNELLRITNEPNIKSLYNTIEKQNHALFMEDGGNKKTIYLWLKLCEYEIDIQNDIEKFPKYNHDDFVKQRSIIKKLLNTNDYVLAITNIRRFLNKNGIGLVIKDAIPTSLVRGATTIYNNHPMIYLSTRYKRIDLLYFALVHELFHIYNKDYENEKHYSLSFDLEETELITNKETREFFIKKEEYSNFLNKIKDNLTKEEIIIFAKKQGVVVDIVMGFLQRDKRLKYSEYNDLRTFIDERSDFNVYTYV